MKKPLKHKFAKSLLLTSIVLCLETVLVTMNLYENWTPYPEIVFGLSLSSTVCGTLIMRKHIVSYILSNMSVGDVAHTYSLIKDPSDLNYVFSIRSFQSAREQKK